MWAWGGLSAEAGIRGLNWGFASGVGLAGCMAIGGGGLRVVVRVVACLVPGWGRFGCLVPEVVVRAGGTGVSDRGVRGYLGDGC